MNQKEASAKSTKQHCKLWYNVEIINQSREWKKRIGKKYKLI